MTDIVEKLRDACVIDRHYGKSVTLTLDYDDYMEAADEITRLRAQNAELVEALKRMLLEFDFMVESNVIPDVRNDIIFDAARAAITKAEKESGE